MKILVILAHPDRHSFNSAIAGVAVRTLKSAGHEVSFRDLCAWHFPPLLEKDEIPSDGHVPDVIQDHIEDLVAADGIVVVHPNWWGQPPAILKGWIDRVVRPHVAYMFEEGDSGEGIPVGLLKARKAVVLNTSNTDPVREKEHFGDPLEILWKTCIFDLCGVKDFFRRTFSPVVTSTEALRAEWLDEVAEIMEREFPPSP